MWQDILHYWYDIWQDPNINRTVIGGAFAGFVSAVTMFLIVDVLWRTRQDRIKSRFELDQKRLESFYAPLYRFYCDAYSRFDLWHRENPHTLQVRQPFFDQGQDEVYVEKIFSEHSSYASSKLIRLWSNFKSIENSKQKQEFRNLVIATLIKDYHELRKRLGIDYDREELASGKFQDFNML